MVEPKLNCWEFKRCGREPGGCNADALGICSATIAEWARETNGGMNGGRCCWAISGTLCNGEVQGHFARKIGTCVQCDFFQKVQREEERRFIMLPTKVHSGE